MKRIVSSIVALGTMAVLFGTSAARADERPEVRQASYDRDSGRYREYRERELRRERERRRRLMWWREHHRGYGYDRW